MGRSPCDLVSDLLAHRKSRKPYKLKGSYRTATGQLQGSYRAATLQLKPKGHSKSSEPQASWSSFSPFSRIDFPGIHRRFFVEAYARSSAFPEQRLTSCAGG